MAVTTQLDWDMALKSFSTSTVWTFTSQAGRSTVFVETISEQWKKKNLQKLFRLYMGLKYPLLEGLFYLIVEILFKQTV